MSGTAKGRREGRERERTDGKEQTKLKEERRERLGARLSALTLPAAQVHSFPEIRLRTPMDPR